MGIEASEWAGFKHFAALFSTSESVRAIRNTIEISLMRLIISIPSPILLAGIINELRNNKLKKATQTVSYLPHLISWVVASGLIAEVLSPSSGIVNAIIKALGGTPVYFMANAWVFRVADIIETYNYRVGLGEQDYSFLTAIGLFKNVVGVLFIIISEVVLKWINNRMGDREVYGLY